MLVPTMGDDDSSRVKRRTIWYGGLGGLRLQQIGEKKRCNVVGDRACVLHSLEYLFVCFVNFL